MPQLSAAQVERERHRQIALSSAAAVTTTTTSSSSRSPRPLQQQLLQHQQQTAPESSSLSSSQETDGTGNTGDTTGTGITNGSGSNNSNNTSSDGSRAEIYVLDGPGGREDSDEGVHALVAHIQRASAASIASSSPNTTQSQTQTQTATANKGDNDDGPPYPVDNGDETLQPPRNEAKRKGKEDAVPTKASLSPAPPSSSKPSDAKKEGGNSTRKKRERRLFVFHGLRPELLSQLPCMGVDPEFITAHLLRKPYRPRLVQLNGQQRHGPGGEKVVRWSFAHFQYPELVCRVGEESSSSEEGYLGAGRPPAGSGPQEGGGKRDHRVDGGRPHAAQGAHGGGGMEEDVFSIAGRIAGDPPVLGMPGGEDAAVMCRASLWMSEKGDAVLLLDRPIWRDPQVRLRKTYWHDSISNSLRPSLGDEASSLRSSMTAEPVTPATAIENGAPSLHDAMQEWLNNYPADFDYRAVLSSVVELAYDRWLEFFDALDLRPLPSSSERGGSGLRGPQGNDGVDDLLSLYWRSQMALETNADGFAYMNARGMVMPRGRADWGVLLSKIKRRVELLNLAATIVRPALPAPPKGAGINPRTSKTTGTMTDAGAGPPVVGSNTKSHHHHHRRLSAPLAALTTTTPIIRDSDAACTPQEKERERGLDRVAYMGGIFLPFTIVSSILSMSDPFGPGQQLHWVFWVVAVPLAIGAVIFIYADNIRRAEVWIEVSDWHDDHEKANESEKQERQKTSDGQGLPPPVPGPPPAKFKSRASWRRRSRGEPPTLPSIMSESESILEVKTKTEEVSLYGVQNGHDHGTDGNLETPGGNRPQLRRETALATMSVLPPGGQIDFSVHVPSTATSSSASSVSQEPLHDLHGDGRDDNNLLRPDSRLHSVADDDEERLVAEEAPSEAPTHPPAAHNRQHRDRDGDDTLRAEVGTIRTATRRPTVIFQPGADGDNPRAWRRQRLGWGGAWKTMVGYYVPRRGEDVPLGFKAYEVRGKAVRRVGTDGTTT